MQVDAVALLLSVFFFALSFSPSVLFLQAKDLGLSFSWVKVLHIERIDELTIPDVRLTKSRDGTNIMAIFSFDEPSVFDSSGEVGDITGFCMIDEEGLLQSVDASAKFVNGKHSGIEAKYVMRYHREWDRIMRFMERYANQNSLQFVKKWNNMYLNFS